MTQAYKILIADLIGLLPDNKGRPTHLEVQQYIENKGGCFYDHGFDASKVLSPGKLHFYYQPHLSTQSELLDECRSGQYDGVIVAATFIPQDANFAIAGVRIGAGTGNMGSHSWGGGSGIGGTAALMNTPSFNSRATAQMVMKALLQVIPDIDVQAMHNRVVNGDFDTGKHLLDYPTEKLEGKRIAILGFGHIGREVAKLAQAFAMNVVIFAREKHRLWIESLGFEYADSINAATANADVLSVHLGLGVNQCNVGVIDKAVLSSMKRGSVLINYDRGELVNCQALDWALSVGRLSHGAIDADIFKDERDGSISGPLAPYLAVHQTHSDKLTLLPHAAADTEHHSRVAGAKQAVEQIYEVIVNQTVVNRVGDLPYKLKDGGVCTVKGVGKVNKQRFAELSKQDKAQLGSLATDLSRFFNDDQLDEKSTTLAANTLMSLLNKHGLLGPYE